DVLGRVVVQAADDGPRAFRRQLLAGEIAVERAFAFGQAGGHQVGKRRTGIAAVGKRGAAAEEKNAAAATVHEIVNQLLLRRREVVRLHAADDQPLKLEEVLRLAGESVFGELFEAGGKLPQELVLRGAHHRGQLDAFIVVEGAPD